MQRLYEACADYFWLAEGEGPSVAAALDEFGHRPPGVPANAKFVFACADTGCSHWIAMIEGLRDYPRAGIWYLGLMLVDPGHRSKGLGSSLLADFEFLAADAGAAELRLCVFDSSPAALRFWQLNGFQFHRAVPAQTFGRRVHTRTELYKVLRNPNRFAGP